MQTATDSMSRTSWLDNLDGNAILRERDLIRSEKNPAGLLAMSRSNWWRGVASGVHPAPIRVGPKMTGWRAGDVRDWLAAQVAVSEDRASFKAPSRKVLVRLQAAAAVHGYSLTQARNTDTAQVLLLLSKGDTTKVFNTPAEVEAFLVKVGSEVAA